MHVTLYENTQYQTGISVADDTLYGEQGVHVIQDITIGDIEYNYISMFSVRDALTSGGSTIWNAFTDGNVTDKTFYLKENKSIVISTDLSEVSEGVWRWSMSVKIKVGTATVVEWSKTAGSITDPDRKPNLHPEIYAFRFVSVPIDGKLFYGVSFWGNDSPEIFSDVILISDNYFDTSISPAYQNGAAGSDPNSGYGDNDTDTSSVSKIGGINGVIVSPTAHGLHVYEMNGAAYADFMNKLLSKQLQISAVRSFLSVEDSLVSLHMLPTVTRNQTTVSAINVGALFSIPVTGTLKADTKNVYTVASDFIPIGTVANDFLDYHNTCAVLYLPFCGTVPIDIQDIMSGGIEIVYEFDVLQGNCVANVYTTNHQGYRKLQGCYSGNCAYRLPFCGNKDGSGIIAGLIQTSVGATAGSVTTAAQGLYGVLSAGMGSGTYAHGSTAGNSAYYSDTNCYLTIYRPNAVYPSQFARQVGRPSGSSGTVGSFSGFVSGYVHADISGATDAEKAAIENWIERGVVV